MTRLLIEQPSAAGGEISPFLAGRRDLDRWGSSWSMIENFSPMPEGVLTRRPGTRFVAAARDGTRPTLFIPFTFSDGDALQIAANDGYLRFFSRDGSPIELSDGVPYEIAHPWTDAELPSLRWWQQGNLVFVVSPSRAPHVLRRRGPKLWSIERYETKGGPADTMNMDQALTVQCSPIAPDFSLNLLANADLFEESDVDGVWRVEEQTFDKTPAWQPNETLSQGSRRRYKGRIYAVSTSGSLSSGVNPPEHEFGFWSAGGSNVTWEFICYSYGYFRITSVTSATEARALALGPIPIGCMLDPTWRWSRPAWSDQSGWPTVVHMHQQSLVFARDDVVWMTKPGDFYDFDIPPTASDDSGNAFRLTSPIGALIVIRYFISGVVLIAGTSIGEFVIRGASPTDRLLPTTVRDYLDTTEGCVAHRPARTDGGALFIGPSAKRLFFMSYDRLSERVEVNDLTRYARGVLRGGVAEIAYQRDPHRMLWLRMSDGKLASITFWPEEKLVALARHPMPDATVEHLAALPSADQTQTDLWLSVRRVVDGEDVVYYEKTQSYFEPLSASSPSAVGAWHLDCALDYSGVAAQTFGGLSHLEGRDVFANVSGRQIGPLTVTAGAVSLPFAATRCIVGLQMISQAKTLPRETQTAQGVTTGRKKTAPSAIVEVFETLGVTVAAASGEESSPACELFPTGRMGPLELPALRSGAFKVDLETTHDDVQALIVVAGGVFPATVLGLHAYIEV